MTSSPVSVARSVPAKERKKLASSGKALKDGSFPIANKADLKNAIQAYGRASNKAAAKRHIIKRAKALGATNLLPDSWKKGDSAMAHVECPDCPRTFLDGAALVDHAESVHTLNEKRSLVSKAVRTIHGGDAMLIDLSDDWLIYDTYVPKSGYVMYKQSYKMDSSGKVTLSGDPSEVMRKVSYIPAPKVESASATLEAIGITIAGDAPLGRGAGKPRRTEQAQDETAMSQSTIEAAEAVKCPDCDKTFKTPIEMKMHRKKAHKGGDDK